MKAVVEGIANETHDGQMAKWQRDTKSLGKEREAEKEKEEVEEGKEENEEIAELKGGTHVILRLIAGRRQKSSGKTRQTLLIFTTSLLITRASGYFDPLDSLYRSYIYCHIHCHPPRPSWSQILPTTMPSAFSPQPPSWKSRRPIASWPS
jgi:hypothetical protein